MINSWQHCRHLGKDCRKSEKPKILIFTSDAVVEWVQNFDKEVESYPRFELNGIQYKYQDVIRYSIINSETNEKIFEIGKIESVDNNLHEDGNVTVDVGPFITKTQV